MKKHLFVLALLIVSILCITACGSNAEEIDWENIILGDVIPEPQSNKMEILSNDNEWLNIDIEKISENEYYEYQRWCGEDKGFTIDTESYGSSFYGYNQDGYYLSLYYNDSEKELNIDLEAPISMTDYKLPDFATNEGLPLPDSTVGNYNWEYEDSFYLYVGNTTIDTYNTYKDKCIEAGFTVEPYESPKVYYATNSDGYYLSIGYKGFDIMYIEMSCPEDSVETENSSEEIIATEDIETEGEETLETNVENTADSEKSSQEIESNNSGGFWDFLYEDIAQFEFELNADEASYTLIEYNYLSLDATEEAIIPATYQNLPVTAIGDQAFYACEQIERVVIPEGVTKIGAYAFYHCENLAEIIMPESLRQIKEYAFEGCDSLTEINQPQALSVGFRAFYECENLENVTIGNSINGSSFIDGYAFYKCGNLKTAILEGVTTIEGNAFCYCDKLTTVNLSSGLSKIGDSAFEFCSSLEEINFNGTTDEWLSVDFWPWWNKDTGDYEENILKDN